MKRPTPRDLFPQLLEFAATRQFDEELSELFEEDSTIADVAAQAIEWALIRKPGEGVPIPRTPVWIYPIVISGLEYVVYYQWEDRDKVELLSIKLGLNE